MQNSNQSYEISRNKLNWEYTVSLIKSKVFLKGIKYDPNH